MVHKVHLSFLFFLSFRSTFIGSDFEGFLYQYLRKSQYFPFQCYLSAKQGNHWYHFYNFFGMTRSLTGDWPPGPSTLEVSTIPTYSTPKMIDKAHPQILRFQG